MLTVKHSMYGVLLHAGIHESLSYVAKLLFRNNADAIIIRDRGLPVGIITSKDILRALMTIDKDPKEITAGEFMTSPIVTVDHEDDFHKAREVMLKTGLRKLAVKKETDIIGLFVQKDLIKDVSWLKEEKA